MPIRCWAPDDRPRERLRRGGPASLSTRELLAILVGSGSTGRSALDIADALLVRCEGSLGRLAGAEVGEIECLPGMGPAKAARLSAALELGHRALRSAGDRPRRTLRGPEDVFELVGPRLRGLRQEEFHVILLDVRHRIRREVLVSRGTLDASLIHARDVFRAAILESAAGVILVHNHPSGDPTPSIEDRVVTRHLIEAGRTIGIPVLDHVIVGEQAFASLMENGDVRGAALIQRPGPPLAEG